MCCVPVFALHCSCPLRIKYPYRDISKHFGEKICKANSPKIEKKFSFFFLFSFLQRELMYNLFQIEISFANSQLSTSLTQAGLK